MAIIYIDPTSSTNGTGTLEDPKNTWVGLTWIAGNSYLQKAGTTFTTAVGSGGRIAPSVSGTPTARITLGTYGEGPKAKIINQADTGINIGRRSYITVENLCIENRGATASAIGGGGDTATPAYDNIIRNNIIYGGTVEGIYFLTPLDRQPDINLLIENNLIYNVGGHGILCAGSHINTRVVKNTIKNVGFSADRHGISSFPHRTTSTPTWTLVSGNIYSTPIGSQTYLTTVTNIFGVRYVATGITLARATVATSPGLNQFGFSGGLLYINIGGVPTGSIVFSYTDLTVHFLDNIVENVTDFNGIEGHGIQFDDLTSNSTIKRNYIANVEGAGIQVNMGRNNVIENNIIVNAKRNGINLSVNGAVLNQANFNTIITGPLTLPNTVGIACGANNTARNNCILKYSTGITGTATSTENYNVIFESSTLISGGITQGTNTIAADPKLTTSFYPTINSPLNQTGIFIDFNVDYDGNFKRNPPTIGALEYKTSRGVR